jgi:hypothetical protein
VLPFASRSSTPRSVHLDAPEVVLQRVGMLQVVRDDLMPGGTKARALSVLFDMEHREYVQVGHVPDVGRAVLHKAPERFEDDAKVPPPFPSCSNYDAKAWRFIAEHAKPHALFWNVAK